MAIARAIVKNPKLLLCDEPTGALDDNTGRQVLELLYNTCRHRGTTVIVVTHNQAITPIADRIITVRNGVEYISYDRGSSSKGDGIIRGFVYLPKSVYTMPVYTGVYIVADKQNLSRFPMIIRT